MKLNFITLYVRNLAASEAFYTELAGLSVQRRLQPKGLEITFLGNVEGETSLELIQGAPEPVSAQGLVLSFRAPEPLALTRRKAVELGYEPSEIQSGGPKPDSFTVKDPDGITVEFGV